VRGVVVRALENPFLEVVVSAVRHFAEKSAEGEGIYIETDPTETRVYARAGGSVLELKYSEPVLEVFFWRGEPYLPVRGRIRCGRETAGEIARGVSSMLRTAIVRSVVEIPKPLLELFRSK
jgi:hypothetical protein